VPTYNVLENYDPLPYNKKKATRLGGTCLQLQECHESKASQIKRDRPVTRIK
jgi:hypothetical protein